MIVAWEMEKNTLEKTRSSFCLHKFDYMFVVWFCLHFFDRSVNVWCPPCIFVLLDLSKELCKCFFFLLSLCHSHCDQINCQSLVITPSVTPEKREKRHTTTTPSSSTIDCCTERKKWSVNVWTAQKTMTLNYSYIDFWAATIDQISTCHQLLLESVFSINFYFFPLCSIEQLKNSNSKKRTESEKHRFRF